MLPLGKATSEGNVPATVALIAGAAGGPGVSCAWSLAVKSAAIPDVLSGKDLLQGNGLSQAGGALFQVVGIAVRARGRRGAPGLDRSWSRAPGSSWSCAPVARQHAARRGRPARHDLRAARPPRWCATSWPASRRSPVARPPRSGSSSFQMLRYQFWGFGLFTFALYAKNLVQGGDAKQRSSLVAVGRWAVSSEARSAWCWRRSWKDRIPPIRLLLASMFAAGRRRSCSGRSSRWSASRLMLFVGFFSFFLGKISADTITQQAMPDDFRGRAFASVRHRVQPRVHRAGADPVVRLDRGRRVAHAGDPRGVGRGLHRADVPGGGVGARGSATSSRRRTTWSTVGGAPAVPAE